MEGMTLRLTQDATPCLLCGSPDLDPLYQPIGTRRGITVRVCTFCGCLQSRPVGVKGDGVVRVSHLADFGGLRIGKIGRAQPNLDFIRRNVPGFRPKRILDIGASRGAFVKLALDAWPDSEIDAVEPDVSLKQYWQLNNRVTWQKVEDITLGLGYYNLCYLCHSLEHFDTPLPTLQKLREALTPDGWLLIEVPNIRGLMGILDIIEEVFLDKHTSHLSLNTLRKMLVSAGLRPFTYQADYENLTILAKQGPLPAPLLPDYEASSIRPMVQAYASDLARNRELLKGKVWRLNRLIKNEGRPALISGGGRILSALVEAGLDPLLFEGVVDPWLPLDEVHGLPVLSNPKMIGYVKPKVVLVCSRSSAEAMAGEAMGWMPGTKVIRWNQ